MNIIIENYNPTIKPIMNKSNNEINNYVDKIYIINLKSDILRERYICILMKKLNINFQFVKVDKPTLDIHQKMLKLSVPNIKQMNVGEAGCYLSHMWCLRDIVNNNYKNAIIFEDDIIVHKNFHELFAKIVAGRAYDFLMLGAADHGFNLGNRELIKDNIYIPEHFVTMGTHAIYYSLHGAKTLYNHRLKLPVYFDKALKQVFGFFDKSRTGIVYPNLFTVENSTSNLGHEFGIRKYKYNDYYYNECYYNFDFGEYRFIYLDLFRKYILESREKIEGLSAGELVRELLKNYFNNDSELVEFHYAKLDIDYFTLDEYISLLNVGD